MRKSRMMGQIPLEDDFSGLKAVRSVFNRLLHLLARSLPMYPRWRSNIHRLRGVKIGENVFIGSDVFIDNTYPESIVIEDNVTIISRTFIIGHTFVPLHLAKVLRNEDQASRGVIFRKGCYIGAQCIVMPGVTVGEYTIVGAGSIVTEDLPPYSIAIGSPAKVIRTFTKEDIIPD